MKRFLQNREIYGNMGLCNSPHIVKSIEKQIYDSSEKIRREKFCHRLIVYRDEKRYQK